MNIRDLTNQKFNKLTAIKFIKTDPKKHNAIWLFRCDCGREKEMFGSNVTSNKTKSCGSCKHLHIGIDALVNAKFNSYKQSAKRRGYKFDLSYEQFKNLIFGNCFYCGTSPQKVFRLNKKNKTPGTSSKFNGIDRKNNTIGYLLDNCISSCVICNFAKHDKSIEEFENWIKALIEYRK